MKSIFTVLDEIVAGKGGVIYKIHHNDGGKLAMILMTDDPRQSDDWISAQKHRAIVIGFSQKDSTITRTTRPDQNLQMNLSVILRPTYIPKSSVLKIEVFETVDDIKDINDMVKNLRKTFDSVSKTPELILPA